MVLGDPALVVALVETCGVTGGLVAGQGLNLNLLNLLDHLDGGGAAGLGEQSLDPCLVDKPGGGTKDASQEEVQEDAMARN